VFKMQEPISRSHSTHKGELYGSEASGEAHGIPWHEDILACFSVHAEKNYIRLLDESLTSLATSAVVVIDMYPRETVECPGFPVGVIVRDDYF
jgi:hypothetical protein